MGDQTAYVGLWANLDARNTKLVKLVAARTGTAYLGLNLAEADQAGGLWDTETPADQGDPSPCSWGAHAALLWAWNGSADTDLVQIVTWGRLQPATWRWMRSRMEEAHALFHPQMARQGGLNFADIDRDRLAVDVAGWGARAA